MLIIKETKIQNISKNKFEELKITFIVKKEDYSNELEQKLFQLNRDWSLWALVFEDIWCWDDENRNKLLQDLDFFIRKYVEKIWGEYENEKLVIYKRYWITTRKDLTINQLKYEIETYKTWLNYE